MRLLTVLVAAGALLLLSAGNASAHHRGGGYTGISCYQGSCAGYTGYASYADSFRSSCDWGAARGMASACSASVYAPPPIVNAGWQVAAVTSIPMVVKSGLCSAVGYGYQAYSCYT